MEISKNLEVGQLEKVKLAFQEQNKCIEEVKLLLQEEKERLKEEFKHFSVFRKRYEKFELFKKLFSEYDIIEDSDFLSFDDNFRTFDEQILQRYNFCRCIFNFLNSRESNYFKKGYKFKLRFYLFSNKKDNYKFYIDVFLIFTESVKFSYPGLLNLIYKQSVSDKITHYFPVVINNFEFFREYKKNEF